MSDYRYAWRNGLRWAFWHVRGPRNVRVRRALPYRLVAAGRALWLAYARGDIGEKCQDCGRDYFLWHSPNDLYAKVTGYKAIPWGDGSGKAELGGGCFCPACFDRRADRLGYTLVWRPMVWLRKQKAKEVSRKAFRP